MKKKHTKNKTIRNLYNRLNGCSCIEERNVVVTSTVAYVYRSEFDYISRCILDYPNIETGGQLFGFLTEQGAVVVCYAIGPGPCANHQSAFFNQDVSYLQNTYDELNRRYGLRYVGEWHSHHKLGLARPSGHDASTVVKGMQHNHFKYFLLCIGNLNEQNQTTLNAYAFQSSDWNKCSHVAWNVIERESPYRPIVDTEMGGTICHPNTQLPNHGENRILSSSNQVQKPDYAKNYWLNLKENNLVLKDMIDYLTSYNGQKQEVKPMLDEKQQIQLVIQNGNVVEYIKFGDRFPFESPIIYSEKGNYADGWHFSGDIFRSFVEFYNNYVKK